MDSPLERVIGLVAAFFGQQHLAHTTLGMVNNRRLVVAYFYMYSFHKKTMKNIIFVKNLALKLLISRKFVGSVA